MKKRILIIIIFIFFIAISIYLYINNIFVKNVNLQIENKNIAIRKDKNTIYNLFDNFPESKKIFYTFESLYNERDIGPTIYQIDILAELTDESYNNFLNQMESSKQENLEMKFNPNNIKYNWKKVENIDILKSKDIETASVTKIYIDENNKAIYTIVIGGN